MFLRLRRRLAEPRDIASLAVLRILFGSMMAFGLCRFVANGWVEKVLVEPSYFFKFRGFEWTWVGPPELLHAHFAVTALAAAAVAVGVYFRVAIVVFWLGFTYLQLLDVTLYLNHYYLVVLVGAMLCIFPAHGAFSVDAYRRPGVARSTAPAWMIDLLRLQVAVVYFYAALAKAQPDWLLYGQPLTLWMRARSETPVIGPLLDEPGFGLLMSWAGFLYDLTIWMFLLWRRSRPFAYLLVLVFHFFTWVFFEIGMFPVIMVVLTTVFFDRSWPRRGLAWLRRLGPIAGRVGAAEDPAPPRATTRPLGWPTFAALTVYAALQVTLPLRHHALPGDVLWGELGMRFSWKVMVREKNGDVRYRVRLPDGREREVSAFDYLTWRQYSDMSGQPDLILRLGKHIGWDFDRRGYGPVEVRADVWVSLNGRPPIRLVDPDIDLTRLDESAIASWILPAPETPPIP